MSNKTEFLDQFAATAVGQSILGQAPSQTCSACGHTDKANRKTQAKFECVACGHSENADIQAAKNILALGHNVLACGEGSLEPFKKQEPRQNREKVAA